MCENRTQGRVLAKNDTRFPKVFLVGNTGDNRGYSKIPPASTIHGDDKTHLFQVTDS